MKILHRVVTFYPDYCQDSVTLYKNDDGGYTVSLDCEHDDPARDFSLDLDFSDYDSAREHYDIYTSVD